MCGIAGFVTLDGAPVLDRDVLERMVARMFQRGPDDQGVAFDPPVALGMRRLSIIDLEGGHQPIENEDGSIRVICNGEIYSSPELREELLQRGHRFGTRSDTEVLLHGYEEWGLEGLLSRLEGMYAFALHDVETGRLVIARDRVGIKPLLYTVREGVLLFASSMSSLLASGLVPVEPDPDGVRLYLHNQFVPGDRTVLAGVRRLPPGSWIEVRSGQLHGPFGYWQPPHQESQSGSFEDWVAAVRDGLDRAVRTHLLSDVEVGVFLSGGLDSSTVLGLMARHAERPVRAFSIGFAGHGDYDESPFARAAADRFGARLEHQDFTPEHVAEIAPAMVGALEEPLGDAACLPTYLLARMASRELKVVLSGEGADELFAGYDYYCAPRPGAVAGWRRAFGRALRRLRGSALDWDEESSAISGFPRAMPARFVEGLVRDLPTSSGVAALQQQLEAAWVAGHEGASPLARACLVDVRGWLPDDLLVKVDRTTMAHSLEARVPFLDHRLVELACRMPSEAKIRGDQGKAAMRAAFADLLGPELVARRKHGFNLPMHRWLRGPLAPVLDSTLRGAALADLPWLDAEVVESLRNAHMNGTGNFERALWSLHVLVAWFQEARKQVVDEPAV